MRSLPSRIWKLLSDSVDRSWEAETLACRCSVNTDGGACAASRARGVRYKESLRSSAVSRPASPKGCKCGKTT